MINNYANILWVQLAQGTCLARNSIIFFGLLFLMFFSSLEVVGQSTVTPSYEWDDFRDLATVNFGFSGINSDDIVVSIATDPLGNVYTLSFGNGVDKRDSNGNMLKAGFIPASKLDNPLDIDIDESGIIYIADYFAGGTTSADNGKIKVFDSGGNQLIARTILTGFYRPMGLDVDELNVYVAEYNDGNQGPERDKFSRVRIYDKITGVVLDLTSAVEAPFRIAVDSQKNVYVSQAGNNNPQVLVFNPTLDNPIPFPNITSAGSVVIDDFDFIHVLEYAGRVDFENFINYDNVGISEGLTIAKNIRDGINNNEFTVKIFDSNRVLVKTLTDNNSNDLNIEFPLDIAFDSCSKMYLNNSKIFGSDVIFIGYVPSKLEFDLEIYKRTPSFDTEKPTIVSCPGDQNESLTAGSFILPDYRSLANFSDNCDKDLTLVQSPAVGDIITKTTTVTITAKDDAGNSSSCEFEIIIETSTDTEKPVITCPTDITQNVDSGKCGAVVTFSDGTATDNSGNVTVTLISNLPSGSEFPVGPSTVTFEAEDAAGNIAECSFVIMVLDNEKPTIACPQNITQTVTFGESGKVITYTAPSFGDNCSGSTISQTAGLASGSEFLLGKTTNTFEVTDAFGNMVTCSFEVTITENSDTEKPVITCPTDITQNVDSGKCGAIVTFADATATDNSGVTPTITRVDNTSLNSGDLFPVGQTIITFRATDAAGNFNDCSFTIIVKDNEKPTITCPQNITQTVAFGESGKVITYAAPSSADNCSGSIITQTSGLASGSEFLLGKTTNTFEVTDAFGNMVTCSFEVTITENSDTEKPVITCPAPITQNVDLSKCGAAVTFSNATATDNSGNVTVTLISNLPSGSEFPLGESTVTFEAKDTAGNTSECSFVITVEDNQNPTISCPNPISDTVAFGESGKVITYTAPSFDDNCSGSTIVQTVGFASGSEFPIGTTTNTFVVTDASDNTVTCSFEVTITENTDTEKPIITCPTDITQNVDSGKCGAIITFTDATATDNFGSVTVKLISNLPSGSEFPVGTSTVIFEAKDSAGNTSECSFQITVGDNEAPTVNCPQEIIVEYSAEKTYTVPDFSTMYSSSDNCSAALTYSQNPSIGSVVTEDSDASFSVGDNNGNFTNCLFKIKFINEPNTPPTSRDDIYSTLQDESLTVSASSGVLSNDSDAESDVLTAVLIADVSSGTLSLNPDGSFVYVPNTDFFGEDSFTYSANDGSQNSIASTARIEVVRVSENTVTCKESVTLELDENGFAGLNASELFLARPTDLQFSVSQEIFTCEDMGENTITLSYSNSDVQGSCEVKIIVKDVSAPVIRVKDISVALNQFGSASITPEMIDNGSSDNCENLSFSLSKLSFGCKELGENTVTFTATDPSGNSSSASVIVTITGSCEINPFPEVEYIFIYPNPTTGPFEFATPAGVTIQRVEAFDERGRIIMYKEFSAADLQYAMDLSGVQNAVYILKLFTSEGTSIVRVIIK